MVHALKEIVGTIVVTLGALALAWLLAVGAGCCTVRSLPDTPCECTTDTDCAERCGGNGGPYGE